MILAATAAILAIIYVQVVGANPQDAALVAQTLKAVFIVLGAPGARLFRECGLKLSVSASGESGRRASPASAEEG